jgi:hypothetical protein
MIRGVLDSSRSISRATAWGFPFRAKIIVALSATALICGLLTVFPGRQALAQVSSAPPKTLPLTTIAPADEEPPSAPSENDVEAPPTLSAPPTSHHSGAPQHHKATRPADLKIATSYAGPIEPAQARMMIKQDTWAYTSPAKSSRQIEQLHAAQFVSVTGLTHYFARVKLKDGQTGYVLLSNLELSRPADKIFQLTRDTPVLSQPSHYGQKLAEVHTGHDVHVVGTSLNYLKIRMKDGLEGYITTSALE